MQYLKTLLWGLSVSTSTLSLMAQSGVEIEYISLHTPQVSAHPIQAYTPKGDLTQRRTLIRLYPDIEFQQVSGIGGCFNEIGGEALASLPKAQQQEVLEALFDLEQGSALSFCRAAIGASDFGRSAYSFSETPDDYKMKHFSLKRDKEFMVPYMQKALKVNPDIRIFGSPWSPPGWMKHSGVMDQGETLPDLNYLKDDPRIYQAYALYFAKYVKGYAKEGIKVERIVVQNEQDSHTKYPSCRMPVEQMAKFVQGYLRPLFDKEKIQTEIWAGTFRTSPWSSGWRQSSELQGMEFASTPALQKGFDGMGIQYTRPEYLHDITLLAPKMKLMHTESACFNGQNSWTQALTRFEEVASYINGGSENFSYWNMILNETGLSAWGWRQNALISIDRKEGKVTYNPDFAVMNLLSRYIKPGSVRIASYCKEPMISLEDEQGYYLILQNDTKNPTAYDCAIGERTFVLEVPAQSLCGVRISK